MRRSSAFSACAFIAACLVAGCDSIWGLEPANEIPDAGTATAGSAGSSTSSASTGHGGSSSSTSASTTGTGGARPEADGEPCGADTDCQSGACVLVVCCATPCTDQGADTCGTTGRCNPDGSGCALYPAGTGCETTCASGMVASAACDGNGACVHGTSSACPGNYGCASPSACWTTCTTDADCASAAYACSTLIPGKCLLAPGEPCTIGDECASDGCGNGFCL